MSSFDRPTSLDARQQVPAPPPRRDPYFLIILTNYPHLLSRATHAQQPTNGYRHAYEQQQQSQRHRYSFAQGGVLTPGVRIQSGSIYNNAQEQLLYDGLRFQLQHVIRNYLNHTRRTDPIYFVFDWSSVHMNI